MHNLRFFIFTFFLLGYTCPLLLKAQTDESSKIEKLIENNKIEKAIKVATKQLSQNQTGSLYYLRGFCYSINGDYALAVADFERSLSFEPNIAKTHYDMGYTYFLMGNTTLAIQAFDRTIALDKEFAEAYLNRGSVKLQAGDLEGACEDWQQALALGLQIVQPILDENCHF